MASAVCRGCSCGGGGVVAILLYGVNVEYGGGEEYDGSVEDAVVVVCTKITIVKEKHYLKFISPMNHMKPSIQ